MDKLNILVIGSGGREATLATYLSMSKMCANVYLSPGGNTRYISNIIVTGVSPDYPYCNNFIEFLRDLHIGLVVGGSENDLANNIGDIVRMNGIRFAGASGAAALFESDKAFASNFRKSFNIPQPYFEIYNNKVDAIDYGFVRYKNDVDGLVVKYPGLAGGKGVIVTKTVEDYVKAVDSLFKDGESLIIEDFIEGTELSVTVLVGGEFNYQVLSYAQDYKKAFDGDQGPNTGGMGAVTVDIADDLATIIEDKIIKPTIRGSYNINRSMSGSVLYIGLILDKHSNPYVLEYNMRFGDPETQVVIPRVDFDIGHLLTILSEGNYFDDYNIVMKKEHVATVVMAAKGYPKDYKDSLNKNINGVSYLINKNPLAINIAGTTYEDGTYKVMGSRNLNILGYGSTPHNAVTKAYENIKYIKSNGLFYRKDIGCNIDKIHYVTNDTPVSRIKSMSNKDLLKAYAGEWFDIFDDIDDYDTCKHNISLLEKELLYRLEGD